MVTQIKYVASCSSKPYTNGDVVAKVGLILMAEPAPVDSKLKPIRMSIWKLKLKQQYGHVATDEFNPILNVCSS